MHLSLTVTSTLVCIASVASLAFPADTISTASGAVAPFASKCAARTQVLGGTAELCMAVNVPREPEAQNDLFMKVTGPAGRQYTGIGFGSSMNNALMLLIFPVSGNVTASMRLGAGHGRPTLADSSITAEVLDGSTNDGTVFTANVRCRNCRKWATGSVQTNSKAQDLIYAYGSASEATEGDKVVTTYHGPTSHGAIKLDLSSAQGPGGVPASSGTPSGR